jgi:hypothetical protein
LYKYFQKYTVKVKNVKVNYWMQDSKYYWAQFCNEVFSLVEPFGEIPYTVKVKKCKCEVVISSLEMGDIGLVNLKPYQNVWLVSHLALSISQSDL